MPARRQSGDIRIVTEGDQLWLGVDTASIRAVIGEETQQRPPTTKDITNLAISLDSPRLHEFVDMSAFGKAAMQQVGKIQRALMLGVAQEDGKVKYGQRNGLWSDDAQAKLVTWLTSQGQLAIADASRAVPAPSPTVPPSVAAPMPGSSQEKQNDSDSESVGILSPSSPELQPSSPDSPDPDASAFSSIEQVSELRQEIEHLARLNACLRTENEELSTQNGNLIDEVLRLEEVVEYYRSETGDWFRGEEPAAKRAKA